MSSERLDDPKVEFAKSGRSTCRGCHEKIPKDIPRIGIPSPFTTPKGEVITSYRYYHVKCTPRNEVPSVVNYLTTNTLDSSDLQQDTLAILNEMLKGKSSEGSSSEQPIQNPFLEYAKSSRGKCQECEEKIEKGTIRAAQPTIIELDDGRKFVSQKYAHIDCFLNKARDPKDMLEKLFKISLEKKTISEDEEDQIRVNFSDLDQKSTGVDDIIATIGNEPVEITQLRDLSKEQGVDYKIVQKAIDRGLMRGEYFMPTPDTVQKLD